MKTKSTFLFSLFLHASFCTGQNLVLNSSFEDTVACPYMGEFNFTIGWVNPTGYSPDYFHSCASTITQGYGVPSNGFGVQEAHTGNAYAGIITMIETDSREYIQTQLSSELQANHTYEVVFYVSPADVSTYVANDIGAYLSVTPIHSVPDNSVLPLPYTPQIQNSAATNPLNIRNTWTKVLGTFTANGGERYITIGNFKNDASTDTIHYPVIPTPNSWTTSYHYIDDVSVICLDCPVNISEVFEDRINIFPNPVSDYLNVYWDNVSSASITVLNNVSKPVFISEKIKNKPFQIDVSQYSSGVYFLKVETKDFSITKKFLINH